MKSNLSVFALVSLLSSCGVKQVKVDVTEAEKKAATENVQAKAGAFSFTIPELLSLDDKNSKAVHLRVVIEGVEGFKLDNKIEYAPGKEIKFENIKAGPAVAKVEILGPDGTILKKGEVKFEVKVGEVSSVKVELETATGGLSITLVDKKDKDVKNDKKPKDWPRYLSYVVSKGDLIAAPDVEPAVLPVRDAEIAPESVPVKELAVEQNTGLGTATNSPAVHEPMPMPKYDVSDMKTLSTDSRTKPSGQQPLREYSQSLLSIDSLVFERNEIGGFEFVSKHKDQRCSYSVEGFDVKPVEGGVQLEVKVLQPKNDKDCIDLVQPKGGKEIMRVQTPSLQGFSLPAELKEIPLSIVFSDNKNQKLKLIYRAQFDSCVLKTEKEPAHAIGCEPHGASCEFLIGRKLLSESPYVRVKSSRAPQSCSVAAEL